MVMRIRGKIALVAALAYLGAATPIAAPTEDRPAASPHDSQAVKLLTVRTVYVDELRGADGREQIRDMLIGSLHRTGLFVITEDPEHADAYLRGSAEDLIFMEIHRQRDGIQVRGSVSDSERDGGQSEFNSSSFGVGDTDESYRREQKHEAMAAVRLVLRSGEVIWSTTQESSGAKYRGPSADVAEKVAKELQKAHQRARESAPTQNESAPPTRSEPALPARSGPAGVKAKPAGRSPPAPRKTQ